MKTVTIHQAKTTLSRLIAEVEAGEEIVIHRGRVPVARLVPIEAPRVKRVPGGLTGQIVWSDAFFEPMSEEELRLWEGGSDDAPVEEGER